MRAQTIWQSLDRAVLMLLLLAVCAVGVVLWVGESWAAAGGRAEALSRAQYNIYYDVMLLGEALRNEAQQPAHELDRERSAPLETELNHLFDDLSADFHQHSALVRAIAELRDFALGSAAGSFGQFRDRVQAMASNDPANALTYYNSNYASVSRQRDEVFERLAREIEQAKLAENREGLRAGILGATALVLIGLGVLAIRRFQVRVVHEPLQELVATVEKLRQGDFTRRAALVQPDEFGQLGEDLNHLAEEWSGLVGHCQRSGTQVGAASSRMVATARTQQETARELGAAATQAGEASKGLCDCSRELVRTLSDLGAAAAQLSSLMGTSQNRLARIEETMRQMMEASGAMTTRLAALSEKTASIGSVVAAITKVADQTNLLSLNAAIEAEKAGEYGLGFAVVAMEIRRLADQTAVAIFDIEKMVKEMQSAASAGVMGMDKFLEHVRTAIEETREAGMNLAQLNQQVQILAPGVQAANRGAETQAAGADQVSQLLAVLHSTAAQTAESVRQAHVFLEQLQQAGLGLQQRVSKFHPGAEPEPDTQVWTGKDNPMPGQRLPEAN
ncbi:MAG TPA: methyl-accepting chemotaxis protein [Verrucomicrobiae bacterium]|nr:methyl-accepting chemotaxis protein [Verrucomicrobiae bacterium]